jgi:hypothetical protein
MQLAKLESIRLCSHRAPTAWILVCGLVIVALTLPASASPEVTPAGDGPAAVDSVGYSWTVFAEWVAASYARAPALVLGLAALIAVPPLAMLGWLVRRQETDAEQLEVSQLQTQVRRVSREKAAEPRDGVRTGHIPLRPLEAWIEVVNRSDVAPSSSDRRYSLGRTLLRIGRETDNDVCLEDTTVHRYHAAIHRTEDAEFVITDLSSAGGNGVVVNGKAVAQARLVGGDFIELGNARLKFSAAPSG